MCENFDDPPCPDARPFGQATNVAALVNLQDTKTPHRSLLHSAHAPWPGIERER